jgi:hypothetical protein
MTTKVDMHVGDFGTDFIMVVQNRSTNKALPLSGTTTRIFLFLPPDGSDSFVRNAEIVSAPLGADGKLKYTFQEGDIEIAGQWSVQALVQTGSGQWHTDIETFEVGENIPIPSS